MVLIRFCQVENLFFGKKGRTSGRKRETLRMATDQHNSKRQVSSATNSCFALVSKHVAAYPQKRIRNGEVPHVGCEDTHNYL